MRRFLYLNNDSLYSYISQINDGLPTKVTKTNNSSEEKGKKIKADVNGKIDVDFKLLGKGFGVNLDTDIGDVASKTILNQQTDLIEKIIYDEAFDKLQKHLTDNKLLKEDNINIGDFFEVSDEMFIVDLEYYKNIFSNYAVLDFIKTSEVENKYSVASQSIVNTGNGSKAKHDKEKLKKEIEKQVNQEYEGVKKTINAILNIVPYNKFGIMNDYLIVLDDEYFRDKTKVVAYKYGGKMTMLGYMTNIVKNDIICDDSNVFRTFPTLINTFMLGFFNKSEIKIIHPIAIYY
jgi:hypothetical protein